MRNRAITLVLVSLASVSLASHSSRHPENEKKANSKQLLSLLQTTNSSAVECITDNAEKNKLIIKRGKNPEDKTGLVVESDIYSYGTNEIRELYTQDSLVINWGEEGNYHLLIPFYAWSLFSASSLTTPEGKDEFNTFGAVISESERVEPLKCRVLKKMRI